MRSTSPSRLPARWGFSLERAHAEAARRAAEDELRESEERFRLMSEHAPVMIWLSGVRGECLHLNQMLRTFWNVDESAIDRFDWQDMMHPDDAPEIGRLMMEALASHSSVTIKGRYLDCEAALAHHADRCPPALFRQGRVPRHDRRQRRHHRARRGRAATCARARSASGWRSRPRPAAW
jgi:PAS domain-containing protein